MSGEPQPMAPTDCDLRGMEWMPFYGARLFESDFEARATDAEFRAAVHLWWACWQQVPAGSLPDDDAVLCKAAGLGRDIKTWKRLRSGNALHGFVKCSDGRLYHVFQCENATNSWKRRLKARERKARWRDGNGPEGGDGTGTDHETERGQNAFRNALDRIGQDRIGKGKKEKREKERKVLSDFQGGTPPPVPEPGNSEAASTPAGAALAQAFRPTTKSRPYGPVRPASDQIEAVRSPAAAGEDDPPSRPVLVFQEPRYTAEEQIAILRGERAA